MYGYIYRITNKVNGKTYIGQHKSVTFDDDYMGSGKLLKLAYKKHGMENFTKTIVTFGMSKMELDVLEKFYIEKERKENLKGCYNIAEGGEGASYKFTEDHKRKIGLSNKGNKRPDLSEYNKKNNGCGSSFCKAWR